MKAFEKWLAKNYPQYFNVKFTPYGNEYGAIVWKAALEFIYKKQFEIERISSMQNVPLERLEYINDTIKKEIGEE